ncbi:hypothetical protein VMCG_00507 [Cytospora schulzeri]|uniref:Uncharacterized protein n=1 Tax=Cytospora schulzeri TaxID=448051 RepID=A0A423X9B8_9PEZI|nr:hypothetical protein VMCG_00507 [Valsa malicola]
MVARKNDRILLLLTRYLWVECEAPDKDQPDGWKDLMSETAGRLSIEHATRPLYLILAIGLKWMIFGWDPLQAGQNQQLSINNDEGTSAWLIDPRICRVPNIQIPGRSYVDGNGVINTRLAKTLDCFTPVDQTAQGQQERRYMEDLNFLETCFVAIMNGVY